MAVTSFYETWTNRSGGIRENYERNYLRTFDAITDDPTDSVLEVISYADCPKLYELYEGAGGEYDTGAFVVDVRATQDPESPEIWHVEVEYATKSAAAARAGSLGGSGHGTFSGANAGLDSPLLRPADVEWSFLQTQVLAEDLLNVQLAEDGLIEEGSPRPIVNSAFEKYDPPYEISKGLLVLTVTKNQASFDPILVRRMYNCVNKYAFLGFEPGVVKLANASARRRYESGQLFFECTYEFQFNDSEDGWRLVVLDQGYTYLVAGVSTNIRDGNGQVPAKPVALNGNGGILALDGDDTAWVYNKFSVYKRANFNLLNLGSF